MTALINSLKLVTCDLSHLHPKQKRPLLDSIPHVHEYEMVRSFTADSEFTDHWVTFALSPENEQRAIEAGVRPEETVTLDTKHYANGQTYRELFQRWCPELFNSEVAA